VDFDPRDFDDPRDEAREERTHSRDHDSEPPHGPRGSGDRDRDEDGAYADTRSRAPDNDDARSLDRGGGSDRQSADEPSRDARDDARSRERDREGHERPSDPSDVFTRHVDLPRGPERERVRDRDRVYTLRGSESRTLATVGAFRVVSSSDLRDHDGSRAHLRSGDLRHLREQGLIETAREPGYRDHAVALTRAGQSLLERQRDSRPERHQAFHAGLVRSREREHDLQVYRAYEKAEKRLREGGAHVERVVLDHELKSEYQRWLHEHDKDRDDYDGHPERTQDEIQEWAAEHDLPYFDDEVHFPDVRIEYVEPDGRWDREDIEVVTPHYRGVHGASVARAGFSTYRGMSLRISGSGGGGRGGRGGRSPSVIEELWR
jgi:DNA-binding PadR family transcriptional regulator